MAAPREVRKKKDGSGLGLIWPDGTRTDYTARDLREACRCAACRHELTGEPILDPATLPADLRIERVETVGQYALGIQFSDGHSTGIFSYEGLKALAEGRAAAAPRAPNAG